MIPPVAFYIQFQALKDVTGLGSVYKKNLSDLVLEIEPSPIALV